MKKSRLLILALLSIGYATAQVNVPDDAFEQYLHNIGYGFGTPNDNMVSANVANIISLNISGQGISDLEGIQHFTSLEELNCSNNNLTSVLFNQLPQNLEVLDFSNNQVAGVFSILATNSRPIREFRCAGNSITSINASRLGGLLQILDCTGNDLTTLTLNNPALQELYCGNNDLTDINVSLSPSLVVFNCFNNQLGSIDVTQNPNLQVFQLSNNNIAALNLSSNPNLRDLRCSYNNLSGLNVFSNNQLQILLCDHNPMIVSGFLTLSQHPSLLNFDAVGSDFTCIQVADENAANNGLGQYATWTKNVTTGYSQSCPLAFPYTDIPDLAFETRLISLGIDSEGNPPDGRVRTADVSGVLSLNVTLAGITDLTGIQDFAALQTLIVTSNNLTSLNVTQNTNLISLQCGQNNIGSLNLSNNPNLQVLYCNGNRLITLDVSHNPQLTALRCQTQDAGFLLRTLNLGNLSNLTELRCNGNDLGPIIDVSQNTSLATFNISNNPNLLCIQVDDAVAAATRPNWSKDVTATYSETFCDDFLTYVPDDNFESRLIALGYDTILDNYVLTANIAPITSLDVSFQNIADLTGIEDFISLIQLDARNNNITSINISTLANLRRLYLGANELNALDVSQNAQLLILSAYSNNLSSLNLSGNPALQSLYVSSNNLAALDLSTNSQLQILQCFDNPLTLLDFSGNPNLQMAECSNLLLTAINARSNAQLTELVTLGSPLLDCIQVADPVAAAARTGIYTNWNIDAHTNFSTSCYTNSADDFELEKKNLKVYPNPVKSYLYLSVPSQVVVEQITLYDIQGREVLRTNSFTQGIYIGGLQDGVYFAAIKTQAFTVNRKLIVSKQ